MILLAAGAAMMWLSIRGEAPIATFLTVCATGLVAASLWRQVNGTNLELARFVAALEQGDLGQSFRRDRGGAGFDRIGAAYQRAVERLRADRASGMARVRYAHALVDGAPTAMLVLGPDDEVSFANKAARRMFGRERPTKLAALSPSGRAMVEALRAIVPGRTASTHMIVDGLSQRVALDATTIEIASGSRRVVSVRAIQAELDEAELTAQVDLVRVLTHEVMNSLTPVTSLAGTAERLIGEVDPACSPSIPKVQRAIAALARRADDLEQFVDSYRDFSATSTLRLASVDVAAWMNELKCLFAAMPAAAGVSASWPAGAGLGTIIVDRGLITQVMLNLLKNAGEALAGQTDGVVAVEAAITASNRLRVVVADNGPGLDPTVGQDVFLPFFTTKARGTGIGLSFARKVVLLHGGQIGFSEGPGGRFELLLPTVSTAEEGSAAVDNED